MIELKKRVNEIMKKLNNAWTSGIEEGQKGDGIDMTKIFQQYAELTQELDSAFLEAQIRIDKPKTGAKKGFFG